LQALYRSHQLHKRALTISASQALLRVNELARGRPNNELLNAQDAVITAVGQIRQGEPVPQEEVNDGLRN